MSRRLFVLLLAALIVLPAPAAWAAEVTITGEGAEPASVEAEVGETIMWTNDSDRRITLVSEDPAWTSGPLAPGESFSLSYESAGTYDYESNDGSVTGEIVVAGTADAGDGDDDGVAISGGAGELPATGRSIGMLAVVTAALIGVGALLLRRSRT